MNILVVDDNEANLLYAAEVMRERDWHVVEARGGLEAMMLLESDTFDLILADIRMPHLSGEQLIAWLQSDDRFSHTRVIAYTAHAQSDEIRRLLEVGFDRVVVKPVTAENLLKAADECLARPRRKSSSAY